MRIPALLIATFILSLAPVASAGPGWHTDFEKAKKLAKKEKKPILADFTGSDWCHWCKKLDQEVFSKAEFKAWAKKNVILLEVDFPANKHQSNALRRQNERLQKTYGIEGYPTILFLDADGKKLGSYGYDRGGPARWTRTADGILAKATKKTRRPVAGGHTGWLTSYEDAMAKAKAEKKLLLADFTGSDWCYWCKKLHQEVFSKPEFKRWAKENVVLLMVDYPKNKPQSAEVKHQNQRLQRKYEITGYPTILFLDARGEVVGRTGYLPGGPSKWLEKAKEITDSATK